MRILTNTTSPYARIALAEKGFDLGGTEVLNPWSDPEALLKLNTAARVPTLELDDGTPLTESLLILLWLEKRVPEPSLLDGPLDRLVSQAGRAMGVIEAMANIVTATMQWDPQWGESRVGLRRRRSIVTGFAALEADPPVYRGAAADIAVITAVTAIDYLRLRFKDAPWAEPLPRLQALGDQVAGRPSFAKTRPYL